MQKSAVVNTRMDAVLKSKVGKLLETMGLSHSTAITLFYKQILMQREIPFRIHVPNKETLKSLELTSRGKGTTEYNTVEELFE